MKNRQCEICSKNFIVKYASHKRQTCSKECKNKLASQITQRQFATEESRLAHAKLTKEAMIGIDMKEVVKKRRSYKGEGHPLYGKARPQAWKDKQSQSMMGKYKGVSWKDKYTPETCERMRQMAAETAMKRNSDRMGKLEPGQWEKIAIRMAAIDPVEFTKAVNEALGIE